MYTQTVYEYMYNNLLFVFRMYIWRPYEKFIQNNIEFRIWFNFSYDIWELRAFNSPVTTVTKQFFHYDPDFYTAVNFN